MKLRKLLCLLVFSAMVLAACIPAELQGTAELEGTPGGAEPAGTQPAGTEPVGTEPMGTEAMGTEPAGTEPVGTEPAGTEPAETEPAATEPVGTQPAGTQPPAGAEVVPSTGSVNPARVSNLLDFEVLNQSDEQVGAVEDMILNLETKQVDYVVLELVGLEGNLIPMPWEGLQVRMAEAESNEGAPSGVAMNVDPELVDSAPEIDLSAVPEFGGDAPGWDTEFRDYWQAITEAEKLRGVILASEFLGFEVHGEDSNLTQGTIVDVILELRTGAVQYVVIAASGGETGDRLVPIPLDVLGWDSENARLVLLLGQEAFNQAPSFEGGEYPDTTKPDWDAKFQEYWQANLSQAPQ